MSLAWEERRSTNDRLYRVATVEVKVGVLGTHTTSTVAAMSPGLLVAVGLVGRLGMETVVEVVVAASWEGLQWSRPLVLSIVLRSSGSTVRS